MTSYFYLQAEQDHLNNEIISNFKTFSENKKFSVYILNRPLTDQRYQYKYTQSLIILAPKHKITIINYGDKRLESEFKDYIEDLIEDIGYISDKYLYKEVLGRARTWRDTLLNILENNEKEIRTYEDIERFFNDTKLSNNLEIKKVDLLISLFIGSINDIDRVKPNTPTNILDKVKQKILLFDGDQTRFIYQASNKKRTTIQGLSGTGKTELLLHKLKESYISDPKSKIFLTCHNKVLADSLEKRIPSFFNFMKVEQQIEWKKRLWCKNAWGSSSDYNSGAYSYICNYYQIPFHSYSPHLTFSYICEEAIKNIKTKKEEMGYAFTYMFIDESQDFQEPFFNLCELVTEKKIYIAGDVFQNIFDEKISSSSIEPDYLLNKCYRTDPKTLMFAHGLGMGLFEENKLRWLEEKEWIDCGYNVEKKDKTFYLSREPLRRFEDLDENFESIKIINNVGDKFPLEIINLIDEIKKENDSVTPDDIGIIFLDSNSEIYELSNILSIEIQKKFDWETNKVYETKVKIDNTVLISNRNNVKGLEFPFVICITKSITNDYSYRNSLYTMLTRSFLKSFLVILSTEDSGFTKEMEDGLREITENKQMIVSEPSEAEKKKIKMKIKTHNRKESQYDMIVRILKELNIDEDKQKKILNMTRVIGQDSLNEEDKIREFVKDQLKYMK